MDIEKMLMEEKNKMDSISAPKELQGKLASALDQATLGKGRNTKWILRTAAALLIILILGNNISTLAYYAKKFMGYDQIMNTTVSDLNQMGKGQEIGETYTFKNGVILTIDGVMFDDNNLILFYTYGGAIETDPDKAFDLPSIFLTGFLESIESTHSSAMLDEENKEIKYVSYYEPPRMFTNKITFKVPYQTEQGDEAVSGNFVLDRNKAMGRVLKKKIDRSVRVENRKVTIQNLTATPTSTKITGKYQSILGLGKDVLSENRIRPKFINMRLLADGIEVPLQGSGLKTDLKGISFEFEFDALPSDIDKLQLVLDSVVADHDANARISLEKGMFEKSVMVNDQEIMIHEVSEKNQQTSIRISGQERLFLTKVYLNADGKRIGLLNTTGEVVEKATDGKVTKYRTLNFDGVGKDLTLEIDSLMYLTEVNQIIEVK